MSAFLSRWPAVMDTTLAHEYCGGRLPFEELLAAFPGELKPLRTTPRGHRMWRTATIDRLLEVAEATGVLRQPVDPAKAPGKSRRPAA